MFGRCLRYFNDGGAFGILDRQICALLSLNNSFKQLFYLSYMGWEQKGSGHFFVSG